MMYLPFSLHHLTRTSGRGSQEDSLKWLYACAPLGFPVPQIHCYPTHSAPCHPLTMAVGFSPPAACWRWQLKISSARFRYCAIFRFTASRRSLLGSTAVSTEGGHEVLATCPGRIPWSPGHTPQRDALDPSPFYTGPLAAVPEGCPSPLAKLPRATSRSPYHSPRRDVSRPLCSSSRRDAPVPALRGGLTHPVHRGAARPRRSGSG